MFDTIRIYRMRFAVPGEFTISKDGWTHCKTTPFYIFAQAFEGHYEVETPHAQVICETGGAFFPHQEPL